MNYSELDDTQLLSLLQGKSEEAFAEIYSRYWKLLYNTAYNILQNEEVAKDAVQEVFIALWQRSELAIIQNLKAYLQQAARFQVLKSIRDQKTDDQFYIRLAAITADIVYENPLLFKEQEAFFRSVMSALPDDCKLIFTMSREEQMTYKQIAAQLNISEKTVEKKMSLSLKYIRQALEQNKILCLAMSLFISCRY